MPSRDPGRGEVPSGAWSCCLRVGCWPHAGLPFPDWGPGSPLRTVYPATLLVGRAGLGRTIGWFTTGVFLRRRRHLTGPLGTSLRGAPGEGRTLGQGKAAGLAWGPGAWLWNQTLHPLPLHAAEVAGISLLPQEHPCALSCGSALLRPHGKKVGKTSRQNRSVLSKPTIRHLPRAPSGSAAA